MKGNEPSSFFFRLMRDKQRRELILNITNTSRKTFDEEGDILMELWMFYWDLFAKGKLAKNNVVSRRALLEHTYDNLIKQDRSFLGAVLDLDELEATLKCMSFDRSLGPDRITIEVIWAC